MFAGSMAVASQWTSASYNIELDGHGNIAFLHLSHDVSFLNISRERSPCADSDDYRDAANYFRCKN